MLMRIFSVFVLLLLTVPLVTQDSDSVAKKVTQEATVELAFRNPNPPIAKLVLNAIGTGEVGGRKSVVYSVHVNGLPQKKSYILMSWDIGTDAPIIALQDVRIDDKGQLRCGTAESCPGSTVDSELRLTITGMLGQPRRFVLTGKDKKPLAMGEAVPFPAISSSGECSAEAVILRPNAAATLLIGQGFIPEEEVREESSSRGEGIHRDLKADPNGRVLTVVLPFVKGYDSGETSFSFHGSKCSASANFEWGKYAEERTTAQPSPQ